MEYMTIGEVSSCFKVSARMIRYYEKEGLIKSTRKEGYAYRIYDAGAVKRIQQIVILRKLQIPLKQIHCMIEGSREEAICLLEERHHLKEERKMNSAKEMVEKGNCVRIVMVPPCTVASYQVMGDAPEEEAGEVMKVKKHFSGGLYAAYAINFPEFQEWNFLVEWAEQNETYQADFRGGTGKALIWPDHMDGCMEEYLNAVYSVHMGWPENGVDGQVELLLPIKRR